MRNPMLNEEFLLALEQERNRETFARITLLDINEMPIEYIEGKVTSGSINIDGKSAVRRSCSLTLIAEEININDFYWGLKSKFILEIGIKNKIDIKNYDKIVWFKQGIYVINTFNVALAVNNYTINISGKDKMCLLNGDLAGNIMNITEDFGTKWFWQNEEHTEYVSENISIKEIIYRGVQTYAGELPHNIIINDIAECGVELLKYRGTTPMYLIKNYEDKIYENMTINGDMQCWFKNNGRIINSSLSDIELLSNGGKYETEISSSIDQSVNPSIIYFNENDCNINNYQAAYTIYKVGPGLTVGYRLTNLTYAGELIANADEPFTSILDKIVKMLGNFEYFYDLDGHFVFQKKKNYIQGNWTGLSTSQTNEESTMYVSDNINNDTFSYKFDDNYLITSFANTPSFSNVKNDFTVWGKRKTSSGVELPIHMRCAIDKKPEYYKNFEGKIFTTREALLEELKKEKREELLNNLINNVKSYNPQHISEIPLDLQHPTKNEDGSWTAGWWDIRDWHDYYVLLTGKEPNGTMKWYSHNSPEGCCYMPEFNSYVWLIIKRTSSQGIISYNTQHGSSLTLSEQKGYNCTYYETEYTDKENGVYSHKATNIKKFFMYPFASCSDTHTYIEFLENDIKKQGNQVYFYNPQFPEANSYDELIEQEVQKEFEEISRQRMFNIVDWREIIYQMALDYYSHSGEDDFAIKIRKNNTVTHGRELISFYPNGRTGYERYYTDMEAFWRKLYCPEDEGKINGLYYDGFNPWNPLISTNPEQLEFWIDFLDPIANDLEKYSVQQIGPRPKVVNEDNIKAIYYRETPNILFEDIEEKDSEFSHQPGYTYIRLNSSQKNLFTMSSQGVSSKDKIEQLLNSYTYAAETVNITGIPIYRLDVNTRVSIKDVETNISGEYIVSKINIPLTYNGAMNITVDKAVKLIY